MSEREYFIEALNRLLRRASTEKIKRLYIFALNMI